MAKASSLSKGEKRLLIFVSAFVIIMLAVTCWQQANNVTPVIYVPTPPEMPTPNARDYYLQARNSFVPYNIPRASGPSLYQLTFDGIESNSPSLSIISGTPVSHVSGTPPPPSLAEMQQLLRLNEPAFATLRAGFHYDYRATPIRSFSTVIPELAPFRQLARHLVIASQIKRLSHDWYGAANYSLDGIRFGSDIPCGGPLIDALVDYSVQTARAMVWKKPLTTWMPHKLAQPHAGWRT